MGLQWHDHPKVSARQLPLIPSHIAIKIPATAGFFFAAVLNVSTKNAQFFLSFGSILLGLLLLVTYWAGLFGDFAFDDYANIVENAALRMGVDSWASAVAAASSGASGPLGRPISMFSFALNYQLFGAGPFSFKLTNLAIHYANSLLVFVLTVQLTLATRRQVSKRHIALLAAAVTLVWALHPMNAMPVLHVVQRMTSLSALFMLCGLTLYLCGRMATKPWKHYAIAISFIVCWPAAIYSKETGLLFPVYVFLCEWLLLGSFQSLSRTTLRWWTLITVATLLIVSWLKWDFIVGGYRMRDFSLADRLYTEPRVLWFYVQQLLLPIPQWFGLYHDDIIVSRGWHSPTETSLAMVGWVAVAALAYHQRNRRPLFTFAVFWFLGSHLLESSILPLEIAHEHRNYLASIGLFWWLASALITEDFSKPRGVFGGGLILVLCTVCALSTTARSKQWADDLTRKQGEVMNHPQSARANYEFAISVLNKTYDAGRGSSTDYQLIHDHLRRASALDPSSKTGPLGILYLDCAAGKPKDPDALADLLNRLANKTFTHGDRSVVKSLSPMLVERKLCLSDSEVQSLINAGLSNRSLDGALRGMFYAVAMDYAAVRLQSIPLALQYALAAVASDPSATALRINLIYLFMQSGKVEEAKQEYANLLVGPVATIHRADFEKLRGIVEAAKSNAIK